MLRPPPPIGPAFLTGLLASLVVLGCDTARDVVIDGGAPSPDASSQADAASSDAGRLPCPTPGLHSVTLDHEGETRTYALYVPASVDCTAPTAVWVDFHGTAADSPELAYGLEAQTTLADREGFVLVRPRSRSSIEGGTTIYRWDQNPGDLETNQRFVEHLVAELGRAIPIDPARFYASGFSSGSNMTARMMGETTLRFRGFGAIAGGLWGDTALRDLAGEPVRVYLSSGFRDYLHGAHDALLAALPTHGVDAERILDRELDTGHELYDFQLEEMWAFFETGARPAPGALVPRAHVETAGTEAALLDVELMADGRAIAVGQDGTSIERSAEGVWRTLPSAPGVNWTDACVTSAGDTVVVGEGRLASRASGAAGLTVRSGMLPDLVPSGFGYAFVIGVECGADDEAWLGGYWTGLHTRDLGASFESLAIDFGGYTGQVAALDAGADGLVAVGYYGAARGAAGSTRLDALTTGASGWWLDVARTPSGAIVAVSDHGEVVVSDDAGASWQTRLDVEAPLFAIDVRGNAWLVVGAGGSVHLSRDEGATFTSIPIGLDRFLGGVRFLDDGHALVVGERGLALVLDLTGVP